MSPRREAARWIEILARVGFVAKGLLYATIGILAGCAGMGQGGQTTDTRGAMTKILTLPLGHVLLFGIAIGLVGYAAWRFVEGIADPDGRGNDAKGLALRSSFVVRGAIHLWLAFIALKAAMGLDAPNSSGAQASDQATAKAFQLPEGVWLVRGVAAGIAAFGAYQVYRAITAKLNRDVNKGEVEQETGTWLIVISRLGIGARGVVFMAIGWLLTLAARTHNPNDAGGIPEGLNVIAAFSRWPFIAIAVGLIAYGIYELLCARYRRIRTE